VWDPESADRSGPSRTTWINSFGALAHTATVANVLQVRRAVSETALELFVLDDEGRTGRETWT
jgi:hypothetical protein